MRKKEWTNVSAYSRPLSMSINDIDIDKGLDLGLGPYQYQ